MNRIEERFATLRHAGKKGLVVYIGAGDPDLKATEALALAFDKAGVAILELGVPFSDPLADGMVNQLAAQRGLASHTTPQGVLDAIRAIRTGSNIPIVLYIYFNLIHRHGLDTFITDAANAGVDGLLVLDLPPEEAEDYARLMQQADLCPVFLIAPTTPKDRIAAITHHARGFIYYVSREGVTGMQSQVATDLAEKTARIRAFSDLPIAVGFGVSNPEQARAVATCADAVVVGSAVVNRIAEQARSPDLVPTVAAFVSELVQGVSQATSTSTPSRDKASSPS